MKTHTHTYLFKPYLTCLRLGPVYQLPLVHRSGQQLSAGQQTVVMRESSPPVKVNIRLY